MHLFHFLGLAAAIVILCVVNFFYPIEYWYNPYGSLSSAPRNEGELRIHFLNVGQGDCTILEFPDGKSGIIDCGPETSAARNVVLYARALKIKKFDFLVCTHGDADHCGGFSTLLKQIPAGIAYIPYDGTANSGNAYLSFYERVCDKADAVKYSERYANIRGEGYYMVFLSPHSRAATAGETADENEASAVTWLDYGGVSALFTADISVNAEYSLLAEYALDETIFDTADGLKVKLGESEILKVAHHGSAYSSSLEWLRFLNYETAVISCGAGNAYGHPSETALRNLRTANPDGRIYRTDQSGYVIVTIRKDGKYTVSTEQATANAEGIKEIREIISLKYVHGRKGVGVTEETI